MVTIKAEQDNAYAVIDTITNHTFSRLPSRSKAERIAEIIRQYYRVQASLEGNVPVRERAMGRRWVEGVR